MNRKANVVFITRFTVCTYIDEKDNIANQINMEIQENKWHMEGNMPPSHYDCTLDSQYSTITNMNK